MIPAWWLWVASTLGFFVGYFIACLVQVSKDTENKDDDFNDNLKI